MASFDYRLNPLYPIKECSSCGALYTTDYCCFDGSLGDKIICDLNKTPDLSQRPPQNCPKCGNPVDGHYCQGCAGNPVDGHYSQGCALLRKKFKEDMFTYHPDENSSQSPPQINHHCCYECGDSLEDIFCHQCTCELCGRGAHYGYNCPPKVLVVSNLEPCHNQNVDELPQTVPSFDPTCYYEDGNSFTYDSTSNLVHESPNVFDPPLQPSIYSYEFCGNDAYYGHDCSFQVLFTYDPEPCYNQDFNFPPNFQIFQQYPCCTRCGEEQEVNINTQPFQYPIIPQPPQEEISVEFLQEKRNQIDSMKTFLRKFNRISFYEMPKVLSLVWETILEIEIAFEDKHCQPEDILELFRRLHNDVQNIHKELAVYINTRSLDRPTVCYYDDDDEDYTIAYVKASPPNSELVSLEVMEIVIPEVGGIDDDVLLTIKYDILREKLLNINLLIANIEALKDNPTPSSDFMTNGSTTTRSNISLPDYEAFYDDHIKEISSGSTTTHSDSSLYDSFILDLSINPFPPANMSDFYEFTDELAHIISPPEYDCFCLKNEPNSGGFTMDVVEDIFQTREPRVHKSAFPLLFVLWFCMSDNPGNLKTHAKGFSPPVFISSASLRNHISKSNRAKVYLMAYLINGIRFT
uniref:Pre-mRNA splicing Prp18-interacting factor n=1 Tax=Tanacetum cinerariifolium TaxID=118510 RepID=A0A6L2KE24_TANCI|nr:hypothetical protein [Tanacetum cinerariifolium]